MPQQNATTVSEQTKASKALKTKKNVDTKAVNTKNIDQLAGLDQLGHKINAAKANAGIGDDKGQVQSSKHGAMHMSIELLAGVVAGLLIGYYLDKYFGTAPLFFIICFILGFAGAVRNIIRTAGKNS